MTGKWQGSDGRGTGGSNESPVYQQESDSHWLQGGRWACVEQVALGFGTPEEQWLDTCTRDEALRYLSEGHFHKGSMEPKVRAIVRFIEKPNRTAFVTNPANLSRALRGETGTRFSN